jgi:DNA-binding transcriptional LysR family regulator
MSSFVFARFVRYFDTVSRVGSIRKAAQQLSVSPSAIDRQLLHAEDELRVRLFERLPRGCGSPHRAKS